MIGTGLGSGLGGSVTLVGAGLGVGLGSVTLVGAGLGVGLGSVTLVGAGLGVGLGVGVSGLGYSTG